MNLVSPTPTRNDSNNALQVVGTEGLYMQEAIRIGQLSGGGLFTMRCEEWLKKPHPCYRAMLTSSGTSSLELAALVLTIVPGDEIIMPSYSFVSTADAFVLRGATIVFVDVRPDTMNIDESLIMKAITPRNRAIVPVHYAVVGCEMDIIMSIERQHNLAVVEDAAQALLAEYKGKPLGTIGHIGCLSFHESRNVTAGGQGGAILINDSKLVSCAEEIKEKVTDQANFLRGEVGKYSWRGVSGFVSLSELQAANLWAQLEVARETTNRRVQLWKRYKQGLALAAESEAFCLPAQPDGCEHNGNIFFLRLSEKVQKTESMKHMQDNGVQVLSHYVPLHSTEQGRISGR